MNISGLVGNTPSRLEFPSGITTDSVNFTDDAIRFEAVLKNKSIAQPEPVLLLQQQREVMQATIGIDLGAKVAGGFAQVINKLVSMA